MWGPSGPKAEAKEILDRLRIQLDARLPQPSQYLNVPVVKLDLTELGSVAVAVRDYVAALRDWSELPDDQAPTSG